MKKLRYALLALRKAMVIALVLCLIFLGFVSSQQHPLLFVILLIFAVNFAVDAVIFSLLAGCLEPEGEGSRPKDAMPQKTCPQCGTVHDIDYPKCPVCKYRYEEIM